MIVWLGIISHTESDESISQSMNDDIYSSDYFEINSSESLAEH